MKCQFRESPDDGAVTTEAGSFGALKGPKQPN